MKLIDMFLSIPNEFNQLILTTRYFKALYGFSKIVGLQNLTCLGLLLQKFFFMLVVCLENVADSIQTTLLGPDPGPIAAPIPGPYRD